MLFDCFSINRIDGHRECFCEMNLLQLHNQNTYFEYWVKPAYINTYNSIKKYGTYSIASQRKVAMYLFGSTIG